MGLALTSMKSKLEEDDYLSGSSSLLRPLFYVSVSMRVMGDKPSGVMRSVVNIIRCRE